MVGGLQQHHVPQRVQDEDLPHLWGYPHDFRGSCEVKKDILQIYIYTLQTKN